MSASPAPEAQSQWKEYKNSEGRIYWSHAVTKQSVWEKPEELRRAMAKTPWKQFTSRGKAYYVNSSTKETVWNLPPELETLQRKVEAEEIARKEREHLKATGQASPTPSASSRASSPDYDEPSTALTRFQSPGSRAPAPEVETVTIPHGGFQKVEEAEAAFIHLLKREGIDEKWTWDQTMRKVVLDPLYKALDTLAQKKAAYEKWLDTLAKEKQQQRDARIAELRPHLTRLFTHSGVIKSYSTMKTADKAFASDKYWRRAKPDERRFILEEYTSKLRAREVQTRKDVKARNISTLTKLVKDLDITVTTRWRDAHGIITRSDAFRANNDLKSVETLDILNVYDDYSKQLEKEYNEESKRLKTEYRRRGRKARDAFKELLQELKSKGELTRQSKWKETLPKIKADERFTNLVGLPGSTPLDLWMDAVDDLQVAAEEVAAKIEERLGAPIKLETTAEEFEKLYEESKLGNEFTAEERKDALDVIHARLAKAAADEHRRAERKRRHRIDDLRDAMRKVQRHIEPDTTYEAALPHIQELQEFKDIPEEEDRKAAFEKFTRRMREKERDGEGSSPRRKDRERDRSSSGRDGRDRRDYRMDVDDDRDRRRERDYRDRERDRDRTDRDWRAARDDRRERDRDRERDRERDRDYRRRDDHRDRDRDRERRRERDREADDRDPKRQRVSDAGSRNDEREEGEI
ncbi:Pre-mRNA-processing protein prp40 [Vanrija pseudolonga]|uniref:Pre-mRNA-processing protein prp40 n=1 Tax=Vanrija pseudolonga TaxID=143232 RepID=A0AAF1BLI9_9TREE|nr:Pre-mRNA-processing protein prp40 [Vanrija pseudolonga]